MSVRVTLAGLVEREQGFVAGATYCLPWETGAVFCDVDAAVLVGERRVQYCLYNRGAGRRVVFEYGTPGTRWLSPLLIDAARSADYELLVIDRPGYGTTSRRPGRRVVDVVDDVRTVLDALNWHQFALWGGSGGAPHALAIAAHLPDRVIACASVVGLAPHNAPGLDWYAEMSPGNVAEFHAAAQGEPAYRPIVERLAAEAMSSVEAGGSQVVGDYELPESDRQGLAARQQEDGYLERMELTYRQGVDGWIDDCIALTRPWGFDLSAITAPTSIWYGSADVLAAREHHEYLQAAIPVAQLHELSGGHILREDDLAAIYSWLSTPSH
jgi:pimeloyl-ACP methyl ester carboxylesterase